MRKLIFITAVIISLFTGCKTNDSSEYYEPHTTNTVMRSFSNDSYIWEGLYFPTNRVMDRK